MEHINSSSGRCGSQVAYNYSDPEGLHKLSDPISGKPTVTSCHPSERGETPRVTFGVSLTTGTLTSSIDQTSGGSTSRSTSAVGFSFDFTIGDKGDSEVGLGGRHLGGGVNLDNDGNIKGMSGHVGWSWPPSPAYGSTCE